jgi:hypothetical protein
MKTAVFTLPAFVLVTSISVAARAEDRAITIKNGETVELAQLYAVLKCQNNMRGLPTAEILVGPPQLSLSLKEAMVVPRSLPNCKQHVPGAILSVTANGVTETSTSRIIVRWRYDKFDGVSHSGRNYGVTMTP